MGRELYLTSKVAAGLAVLAGVSIHDRWAPKAPTDIEAYWDMAVCVDAAGRRVADEQCSEGGSGHAGSSVWHYLRRGSRVPFYGDPLAQRASLKPEKGVIYDRAPASSNMMRAEAVARGGLGLSARRLGAGRS